MSSLAKAFAMFTGASAVGSLTQVAKGKITAVFLGTDGVGILNQLTSLWSLISVVAGMGFYNGIVRHLAEAWGEEDWCTFGKHASSSGLFLVATSLILTTAGCLFSSQLSQALFADQGARADLVCLILLSIPVFAISQVYRAMLNATRSIGHLVRARIYADVASVIVLFVLIYPLGIQGAVLGYIGLHLLYLGGTYYLARLALGPEKSAIIRPSQFEPAQLKRNIGFGLNGLIAVIVGIVTTLMISRWIIDDIGVGANGIFAMAVKVGAVYLGGLTASAGAHYFPALSAANSQSELHALIDNALSLYLMIIPPIVVLLMAGGDILIAILFTMDFSPAATLLLFMLPGDVFRLTAETAGLALVATKNLVTSTSLYVVWALTYLAVSCWLLPTYGLIGVAIAYLMSQILNAVLVLIMAYIKIGYALAWSTAIALLRGLVLVAAVALFLVKFDAGWLRFVIPGLLVISWVLISLADKNFAMLVRSSIRKIAALRSLLDSR